MRRQGSTASSDEVMRGDGERDLPGVRLFVGDDDAWQAVAPSHLARQQVNPV